MNSDQPSSSNANPLEVDSSKVDFSKVDSSKANSKRVSSKQASSKQASSKQISYQKIRAALEMNGAELGIQPELSQIRPQFDIRLFETLSSTNTQLWKLLEAKAQTKAKAGTVVIAQRQTAGRGQRDHTWQSEPGGLYLSLVLEPDWPAAYGAQLTCLSAWGIVTALRNLGIPMQIKWPNDLFYDGKKLGGILTETKLSQSKPSSSARLLTRNPPEATARIKQAVIGVGLNWHNQVPQTGTTLTKILGSGLHSRARTKIDCLETLIAVVLRGILQGYFYQQRVGSQVFMKTYEKLLIQVGKPVSVEKGRIVPAADLAHSCSGKVVGISEEGYLEVLQREVLQREVLQRIACSSTGLEVAGLDLSGRSHQADHQLNCPTDHQAGQQGKHILRIRPDEIHI